MGRSYTPTYRIESRDQSGWSSQSWNDGKPSNAKAEAWRQAMNRSFQRGGTNAHLAKAYGYVPHISRVLVIRQADAYVAADAKAPMFEVI